MKKFILAMFACVFLTGCSSVSPGPGEEAVLVYKPMFIGSGGCGPDIVKTGLAWVAPTTEGVLVNMTPREQQFSLDDIQTSDGVPLDFHSAVQYRIVDSVKLVCQFGADDGPAGMGFFQRVLSQPYLMIVRNAVKKHGLNEMAIVASAAESVDAEITEQFKKIVESTNVPIEILNITLGRANPPDAIKHQRIETAEQQQRIQTEQQRKLAEDMRRAAEESRAIADRAYNDKMGMSTEQWLETKRLDTFRETCNGGKCTIVTTGVSGIVTIK